jgi:chloramphenicol-sensitive protein RarD
VIRAVRRLRMQVHSVNQIEKHGSRYGILYGIAAYGSWGFFPLYFKAVAHVPPVVVLAHRAIWSFIMLAVLVGALGRWRELWQELHSRKLICMLLLSTLFIAANWLAFIYAVGTGQVLQASLGYFVNPLMNVLLGVVFFHERLRTRQTLSIGLAVIGVLVLTAVVGAVPWVALTLALTFSLYALMRKLMPVDGLVSLSVETLIMAPLGLAYLGYLAATGGHAPLTFGSIVLLMLGGPITTIPLLFFGAAARRLRLSTMGILQYLSPTLQFLLAVVAFGEPFSAAQLLSFACIWAAVLIYALDSLFAARGSRIEVLEPD